MSHPTNAPSAWREIGLVSLVVAIFYGWTATIGWQWDDYGLIANAPDRSLLDLWTSDFWTHTSSPSASGMYRPVLSSTYLLESRLFGGPSALGSRLVNLGLLAACAALIPQVARAWGLRASASRAGLPSSGTTACALAPRAPRNASAPRLRRRRGACSPASARRP